MNLKQKLCNYLVKNNLVEEMDVVRHSYSNSRMKQWKKRNIETNNIAPTLDTRCDCLGVVVKDTNMNNKIKPKVIGGIGEKKSNSGRQWYLQDRIYDNEIAVSIATSYNPYYKEGKMDNLRIRKLTPKECWRLMGFDDKDFKKASKVNSNAQLYKQAGNSIVVNVLEAILYNLLVNPNTKEENIIEGQTDIFEFINEDKIKDQEKKDWTGNKTTTYAILGASNHSEKEREKNDFYATDPESLEIFLEALDRDNIKLHNDIWECACGKGHLSKLLESKGYEVYSTDLINRGYGQTGEKYDFLKINISDNKTDILTNPPYKYAKEFVEHSLEILQEGYYSIMFLKIQFLEGKERRKLFDKYPPKYIYVNSSRQLCLLNGDDTNKISSAVCYCWFIWEKGYKGDPIVRWI